ncbi:MAG: PilZ domain-containing protein [Candidatus Auribacterota bacterium]|jgi:c-di-GMP-binding flagellar brake protein YcgR|uniref:PilZ domain-containing protein n=1 Tax=Candidatus Auribacter fodinae TaxID=2093366 RepID=A0A3A4R614_9BACT|nr:MAG: PilZ domain-containing protein [Candidatus Auribacter fodinae]
MSTERREFERIPYEVVTDYRIYLQKTLKKEELFYGKAQIINISGGGIQVRLQDVASDLLSDLLEKNKKLMLEFDVQIEDKTVTVYGKMIWAKEEGTTQAGICFVDIDTEERSKILHYIERQMSK